MLFKSLAPIFFSFLFFFSAQAQEPVTVGSKRFTENYLLAEMAAQLLEHKGFVVKRRFGLGGTMVAYTALKNQEIDLYPDYTGTIAEIFHVSTPYGIDTLEKLLSTEDLILGGQLGFNNTYALAMSRRLAKQLGISRISQLAQYPKLKGGFSHEFIARSDGWSQLKAHYQLQNEVKGIEVPLTYQAISEGQIDFAEAYSTEPMIETMGFILLEDDHNFFPKYEAVFLARAHLPSEVKAVLSLLENKIGNQDMLSLNLKVVNGETIERVAQDYLVDNKLLPTKLGAPPSLFWWKTWIRIKDHLILTLLSVLLATLIAVPLGSLLSDSPQLSRLLIGLTGVLQTIPSIALLTFMIPLFGIGFRPALVGLFIYSLLPILRNTHTAMTHIDPLLITSAKGIGLYPIEIYFSVKLPLAFPSILAGIRTATTLSIGTATLAAFIGAGGLGEPIVTGLALNDSKMVLQGAIPAAMLALIIDAGFGGIHRWFYRSL
jgi:osmoprotectant transport system permease protein